MCKNLEKYITTQNQNLKLYYSKWRTVDDEIRNPSELLNDFIEAHNAGH